MRGITLPIARDRVPWGLLGMLVLVVAAERYVARHGDDLFLRPEPWAWKYSGKLARGRIRDARLVCYGDSLTQVGLSAPVVAARTGRPTYNVSLSGGQAPSSYFLLRRTLDAGIRPEAVLVDFFPLSLKTAPVFDLERWEAMATPGEAWDLARTMRDPGFFASILLAKLLPSTRLRPAIRENVATALRGEDAADRHHVPVHLRRHLEVNGGGMLFPNTVRVSETLDAWSRKYLPDAWTPHPVNVAYVRKFLALAEARRIPVYWLLPPFQPAIEAMCDRSGFDAIHTRFVREATAPFAHVTVIDGRHAGYVPALFFDTHHLCREGAAHFSADVADVVRRTLNVTSPSERWVKLPAYRDRPIDIPLEDLEQSRTAIREQRAVRRR